MSGERPGFDEGGFHLEEAPDAPFDWREFGLEDWPAFLIFWGLTVIVFLQFFTRYVLNDSFGWTEEAARYFLIGVDLRRRVDGLPQTRAHRGRVPAHPPQP